MSSTPPRGPGKPPAATDFDEEAPTSVVPVRPHRDDLPKEFDDGGELDNEDSAAAERDDDDDDDGIGRLDVDEDATTESAHTRKIPIVRITAPLPVPAVGEDGEELDEDDLEEPTNG